MTYDSIIVRTEKPRSNQLKGMGPSGFKVLDEVLKGNSQNLDLFYKCLFM